MTNKKEKDMVSGYLVYFKGVEKGFKASVNNGESLIDAVMKYIAGTGNEVAISFDRNELMVISEIRAILPIKQ